jgi:transposase
MAKTPDEQISLTDPDARFMATSARGSGVVGYNVQSVVDAKHQLIVTHEVTNKGTYRAQLSSMGQQAQEALGTERITALADRGYYAGPEILACEQAGINALVPKSHTSGNLAKKQFDKRDFHYNAVKDEYRCPAGQRAIWRLKTIENGQMIHKYWSSACPRCAIKAQCTMGDYRRIARWEHEAVLQAMQARLDEDGGRGRRASAGKPLSMSLASSRAGWGHALPDATTAQRANRDESARLGL